MWRKAIISIESLFRFLFLISFILAIAGCSGGSGGETSQGKASGYVYKNGNSYIISDTSTAAPSGFTAAPGLTVRLSDLSENTVASQTTDTQGAFEFSNMPNGYLTISVFQDVSSTPPLASANITSYPGAAIPVNKRHAVDRTQATTIALANAPASARVFLTMQPLQQGTVIRPMFGGTGPATAVRTTASEEWFAFVDLNPEADFAHKVLYLSINATNATVVKVEGMGWPPDINGKTFWSNDTDYARYPAIDLDSFSYNLEDLPAGFKVILSGEVVRNKALPLASIKQSARNSRVLTDFMLGKFIFKHNTDPGSIFYLGVVGDAGTNFMSNYFHMNDMMLDGHTPDENRIMVNLTRSASLSKYDAELLKINLKIDDRLDNKKHSTLVVFITSHGIGTENSNTWTGTGEFLATFKDGNKLGVKPQQLKLLDTKACRVNLVLQMCFAEAFAKGVEDLFNALPIDQRPELWIYASSAANEFSYGMTLENALMNKEAGETGLKSRSGSFFTNTFLDNARVSNGTLEGLPATSGYVTTAPFNTGTIKSTPYFRHIDGDPAWCKDNGGGSTVPNRPPIARAGYDKTAAVGDIVQLSGIDSNDPDSDPLTYHWNIASKPANSITALSSTIVEKPSFLCDKIGPYVFELYVNDGTVDSPKDSVTVTCSSSNLPPVANAGPDQIVTTGTSVQLDGTASSDPDNNPLNYIWLLAEKPTGSKAQLTSIYFPKPTFTCDLPGTYQANLYVNDSIEVSPIDSVTITCTAKENEAYLTGLSATLTHMSGYSFINVTGTVMYNDPLPLENATVLLGFTGAGSGTCSATTNASGQFSAPCKIYSYGNYSITVNSITSSTATYDPSMNTISTFNCNVTSATSCQ